jgi:hypothetical protein
MLTPFPVELRWPSDEDVIRAQAYWAALAVELRKPKKLFPICIELKEADPIVISLLSDQCARETESGYSFLVTDKTLTCEPWTDPNQNTSTTLVRKTKFLGELPTEVYMASTQDRVIAETIWLEMVNNIRGATKDNFPLRVQLGSRTNRRVLKVLCDHIATQNGYGYQFHIYESSTFVCTLTKR